MPRNGSSSEGSSSSEDSSSDDDLLLSIPRPGVVFGEGVVGDSDDPFDSPSKVLFKSCLGATKMCGGAEASLQRQGGQQQHHREKERERASVLARAHVCVLAYGLQGSPLAPEWIDLGLRELEALAAGPAWDRAEDLFADKAKPPKAAVIFLHGTGDSGAGAQVAFWPRALLPTSVCVCFLLLARCRQRARF